jgi:hypothetical protein
MIRGVFYPSVLLFWAATVCAQEAIYQGKTVAEWLEQVTMGQQTLGLLALK